MKAIATLKNVDSDSCVKLIIRNLSRILDIRIIDIEKENGTILFLFTCQRTFEQVKQELKRIGHPILNCSTNFSQKRDSATYDENLVLQPLKENLKYLIPE